MIAVIWYVVGLAFLLGYILSDRLDGGRWPDLTEVLTVVGWPAALPLAFAIRWRKDRLRKWWNGLTYEERAALNAEGKGYWQRIGQDPKPVPKVGGQ